MQKYANRTDRSLRRAIDTQIYGENVVLQGKHINLTKLNINLASILDFLG